MHGCVPGLPYVPACISMCRVIGRTVFGGFAYEKNRFIIDRYGDYYRMSDLCMSDSAPSGE